MFHKAVPLLVAISLVLAACGSVSQSEASTSAAKGAEESAHGASDDTSAWRPINDG